MPPTRLLTVALLALTALIAVNAQTGIAIAEAANAEPQVRVLLGNGVDKATIFIEGKHRGFVDDVPHFETEVGLVWPVHAADGMLYVDGKPVGSSLLLEPLAEARFLWEGRPYRGAVRLLATKDELSIINIVAVEDYLRGVVPAEMPPEWPLSALKAQAVAARGYVLSKLDPEADYDLCAAEDCQVYAGTAREHPRTDQAVADTRGAVLKFGGELAQTYYHAHSGGVLASSAEVWGQSIPYLSARSDVAQNSGHGTWQRTLDPLALTHAVQHAGFDAGTVRALRVVTQSPSGRVVTAEFVADRGSVVLDGIVLRDLLRQDLGLDSTRFDMIGDLTARGHGRGHGVGMSQYGAKTLALKGQSFEDILAFYYPDTILATLRYR